MSPLPEGVYNKMRTIKFRALQKEYGEEYIHFSFGDVFTAELDQDKYIIEQFTGLLDKRGVEIYEGDIVEWVSNLRYGKKSTAEVVWGSVGFWIVGQLGLLSVFNIDYRSIEVIGNIHTNTELLAKL